MRTQMLHSTRSNTGSGPPPWSSSKEPNTLGSLCYFLPSQGPKNYLLQSPQPLVNPYKELPTVGWPCHILVQDSHRTLQSTARNIPSSLGNIVTSNYRSGTLQHSPQVPPISSSGLPVCSRLKSVIRESTSPLSTSLLPAGIQDWAWGF